LAVLQQPMTTINVGLESFTESLTAQDAPVVQVDWQPPAGGNEKSMAILELVFRIEGKDHCRKRMCNERIYRCLRANCRHTERCAGKY
jgi:hypothetical protein